MSNRRVRTKNVTNKKDTSSNTNADHVCIICAEPIIYSAVSPCNNVTCHTCCLRQRALYHKKTCLVCRTDHDDVIFTEKKTEDDSKYADFAAISRSLVDTEHNIHFTSEKVQADTAALLLQTCAECNEQFLLFEELSRHAQELHNKRYCDICAKHKRAFVSELTMYTQKQLLRHLNEGDRDGFNGHPRCKFCRNRRFYSEDELVVHIRDRHERCHICDQDVPQFRDYFRDYDDLYSHFCSVHHVCTVPTCVEKRFVVFRDDLDLTAHMLKEHGGLTGLGGRVVVGAGSSRFRSQLTTYQPPQDSTDTKRLRFEERAKHYVNYDTDRLAQFNNATQQFRSKKLTAKELLDRYREVFSGTPELDISLLIYELAELYPENAPQRTQLEAVFNSMTLPVLAKDSFPALGNSLSLSLSNLTWGTRKGRSQQELFPALSKPKRTTVPIKNGPIKYTILKQPQKQKPVVNTFKEKTNYRPTYLDQPAASRSSDSLPTLGSSSLSRTQLPKTVLPESKFPALEKKPKKEIPRVRPVVESTGSWGQGLTPAASKTEDDWGIPIIDKKAEKLKRKQERRAKQN